MCYFHALRVSFSLARSHAHCTSPYLHACTFIHFTRYILTEHKISINQMHTIYGYLCDMFISWQNDMTVTVTLFYYVYADFSFASLQSHCVQHWLWCFVCIDIYVSIFFCMCMDRIGATVNIIIIHNGFCVQWIGNLKMKALEINHHFTFLMHACMLLLLVSFSFISRCFTEQTNTIKQANMIYMRPNTIYISNHYDIECEKRKIFIYDDDIFTQATDPY